MRTFVKDSILNAKNDLFTALLEFADDTTNVSYRRCSCGLSRPRSSTRNFNFPSQGTKCGQWARHCVLYHGLHSLVSSSKRFPGGHKKVSLFPLKWHKWKACKKRIGKSGRVFWKFGQKLIKMVFASKSLRKSHSQGEAGRGVSALFEVNFSTILITSSEENNLGFAISFYLNFTRDIFQKVGRHFFLWPLLTVLRFLLSTSGTGN